MKPNCISKSLLATAGSLALASMLSTGRIEAAPEKGDETYEAKVVAVIDGDTINIQKASEKDGEKQKIIFYGIDCPENAQEFGPQAKLFTTHACLQKTVKIKSKGEDSLGRTIAVVILGDGHNLNEDLVKQGLAWWTRKFAPNDTTLKSLQEEAKSKQKGLWSKPHPTPPWIFRNGQKQKSVGAKLETHDQ